jgi:hypothetical protein
LLGYDWENDIYDLYHKNQRVELAHWIYNDNGVAKFRPDDGVTE